MTPRRGFRDRYGPWAVVTGGAQGLGAEFARQLGQRGLDLIVVDVQAERLADTAQALRSETGAQVVEVAADLSAPDFFDALDPALDLREVGLFVSCAAQTHIGPMLDANLDALTASLHCNARAPLWLTHRLGRAMRRRGRGGLILVSSLAALQGTSQVALYAATKAFNLVLGESLWAELRSAGVDVITVLPGPTDTPNMRASAPRANTAAARMIMPSSAVVAEALDGLGGPPTRIAGLVNRLSAFVLGRLLPRRLAVALMHQQMQHTYPPDRPR